jgi:GWxTD domain-containing protein
LEIGKAFMIPNFFNPLRLVLILTFPLLLFAQKAESQFPKRSAGPLIFDVDICQFKFGEDSTRLEVIYSVYLSADTISKPIASPVTILNVDLQIGSQSGAVLANVSEYRTISLYDSLNPSKYTTFIDLKTFELPAGIISMQMMIRDTISGKKGEISEIIHIRDFGGTFSVSDIYFVSHVQRATGTSVFEKHGVMLVPQPSRLFYVNTESAKAFVFYEINNLTYDPQKLTYYSVNLVVSDITGKEVFNIAKEDIKITASNTSRVEIIPLRDLISGIHKLRIEVIDKTAELKKRIESHFQVVQTGSDKPDLLPMSEEEEAKYLEQIQYIASHREKDIYNQLNPSGKQQFLLQFWKSRDPDPSTAVNEFMVEHFRRIAIAEQKFRRGVNSDMGRIYIQYGPPIDIERQPSRVRSAQVVEIWTYTIRGRTEFIFVDRRGDNDFTLVHSTHPDEYQNPAWEQGLE